MITVIFGLLCSLLLVVVQCDVSYKTGYFTQQLVDHSNSSDTAVWSQMYVTWDAAFVKGGPVHLFIGGEAPLMFFDFQWQLQLRTANETGGVFIALEHRFYASQPEYMPRPDFSRASLSLLTSQQALADLAYFIDHYIAQTYPGSKVVVWGCSYSGALSLWFRSKYPTHSVAGIAPSGPELAQMEYFGYNAWFSHAAVPACTTAVRNAVSYIHTQLNGTDAQRSALYTLFGACAPPANQRDVYFFKWSLTDTVASADQFQWAGLGDGTPLNDTCAALMSGSSSVTGEAEATGWAKLMKASVAPASCVEYREEEGMLAPLRNVTNANRAWYWQMCNEFSYWTTTKPNSSPFFADLAIATPLRWCRNLFATIPNVHATNMYYGGKRPNVTSVLSVNGVTMDPWHLLSITDDTPGVTVLNVNSGHCAVMNSQNSYDHPSVLTGRDTIVKWVKSKLAGVADSLLL